MGKPFVNGYNIDGLQLASCRHKMFCFVLFFLATLAKTEYIHACSLCKCLKWSYKLHTLFQEVVIVAIESMLNDAATVFITDWEYLNLLSTHNINNSGGKTTIST